MQKLIVILGTNASGKSELGIRLARHFDGEIVSADSRQVYRGLDLGSGKITPEDAAGVRHHLIDVADPHDTFTLAQFQKQAYAAIEAIAQQGKRPLLAGGTGLYISAIVEGYELVEVPPNQNLRSELEKLPTDALAQRLQQADPEAARRIDLGNPRRIIRALEVAAAGHPYDAARKRNPRYDCLQLGLTWPREVLAERIERRLEARLEKGMIEEVAALRARGVTDERLERFGLEYRFISRFLRGEIPTLEKLREQLGTAIRQFAKEQVTWFKRDQRVIWLDPFGDCFLEACRLIEEWTHADRSCGASLRH
jgi:tRNA dimethylallyltransferase